MSNDLVKAAGEKGLAAFAGEVADVFAHEAAVMGVQNGAYVAFSGRDGKWTSQGQDIDDGTHLAFHIVHCQRGWRAWKDKKIVDQVWSPFIGGDPLPTQDELVDHWPNGKPNGEGWESVIKIDVRDLEGGPQRDLVLKAEAPWRPVWRLLKDFGEKAKIHKDAEGNYKIPIVEIGSNRVDGKNGVFYSPILNIVDWVDEAEMAQRVQEYVDANDGAVVEEKLSSPTTHQPVVPPPSTRPAQVKGARR